MAPPKRFADEELRQRSLERTRRWRAAPENHERELAANRQRNRDHYVERHKKDRERIERKYNRRGRLQQQGWLCTCGSI
jgi:hypothetical protein